MKYGHKLQSIDNILSNIIIDEIIFVATGYQIYGYYLIIYNKFMNRIVLKYRTDKISAQHFT